MTGLLRGFRSGRTLRRAVAAWVVALVWRPPGGVVACDRLLHGLGGRDDGRRWRQLGLFRVKEFRRSAQVGGDGL